MFVDLNKDLLGDGRVALELADEVAVVVGPIPVVSDLANNYKHCVLLIVSG